MGFGFGIARVLSEPYALVGLAGALALLALVPFASTRAAQRAMALASTGSAVLMVGVAQTYAPHIIDEPHVIAEARYAPGGSSRVLPVDVDKERVNVVERMLYQSATMLGIDSVTGCTTSMAPDWFLSWLPANSRGLLPTEVYQELLPSHFLRSLNVSVVVAPRNDPTIAGWLERAGFARREERGVVSVYETKSTLPRAYFASEVLPFTPDEFRRGLWRNEKDPRTAYVEGLDGAPPPASEGRVLRADFSVADRPSIDVESTAGGFLVVSMTHDPDWRAWVDGAPAPLSRTNAMLLGLRVPAGPHQITLRYQSRALRVAGWLAALGALLIGGLWLRWLRSRLSARGKPPARQVLDPA